MPPNGVIANISRADWDRVLRGELTPEELCREKQCHRATLYRQVDRMGWPRWKRAPVSTRVLPLAGGPANEDEPPVGFFDIVKLDLRLIAKNETESHQQKLRCVHKLQAHIEQSIDELTGEGRILTPAECEAHAKALEALERVRTATERRMKQLGSGKEKGGFSLIEEIIPAPDHAPPAPPDAPDSPGLADPLAGLTPTPLFKSPGERAPTDLPDFDADSTGGDLGGEVDGDEDL